jgi:hypothetical protein
MTPDEIQSQIDALNADADRCDLDGVRRAASSLRGAAKRLQSYMPVEAPAAPVAPPKPPEPSLEPPAVPKGVFEGLAAKLKG